MVTEGAFGKLKGRWKVLSKKCESNPQLPKGLAQLLLFYTIYVLKWEILFREALTRLLIPVVTNVDQETN